MRREPREFFPYETGKGSLISSSEAETGLPGCVRDPRASSRVETGLSHVHTWWESILGLNVKAVQGKQVPLEWTDTSGGLLEWWHDRNAGNSFPTKQGKDPSSRARRRKRGSPGCVRDPRASSRVETGLSHVHTWWESILGLNVKAVQGKPVPLEWTDTSGGLLEWWHDPGVPLAFPVESASS
ncbi:hypothetical protein MJG53_000322 [Ovis ammon polii x Ovis aries]|nr:hypothetical protein MJG53_000322 [Ovis ammon polii x Ovis aries]